MTPRQLAQALNHPKKDSIIASKPITDMAKIVKIKDDLSSKPRDFALFTVGVNTAFRASDLLSLKVGDVKGDVIKKREKKTGKVREFYINNSIKKAVAPLIEGRDDDDWLFVSERGGGPLTVPAFSQMVKTWCFRAGLRGGYSAHTLRKTWARFQFEAGESLTMIAEALGHVSEKVTRVYLGLQVEDMKSMYMREI